MEWNSTCGIACLEFHMWNGTLLAHEKVYILSHVIIVPHANIPHIELFQHLCVGDPCVDIPWSPTPQGEMEMENSTPGVYYIPYVHCKILERII